jgi:hypothetical protein
MRNLISVNFMDVTKDLPNKPISKNILTFILESKGSNANSAPNSSSQTSIYM